MFLRHTTRIIPRYNISQISLCYPIATKRFMSTPKTINTNYTLMKPTDSHIRLNVISRVKEIPSDTKMIVAKYGRIIEDDASKIHGIIISSPHIPDEFIRLYGEHFKEYHWYNIIDRRKLVDAQFIDLFIEKTTETRKFLIILSYIYPMMILLKDTVNTLDLMNGLIFPKKGMMIISLIDTRQKYIGVMSLIIILII